MKRWASSISDISSENSATGLSCLTATFSAMLQTSALFPIAGRAASDDQVAGLEAAGDVVEVAEAGRDAGDLGLAGRERLELVDLVVRGCPRSRGSRRRAPRGRPGRAGARRARPSRRARRRARRPTAGSCFAAASRRRISEFCLTICGVVLGAARRRHLGREAGDHVLAADLLELAVLRQRLGDREDVDRVGVLVQADDRLEDRAVAVAVEVLGLEANVEQDRLDRRLRDHHRPQHRLLGLEVLRGDDAAGCSVVRQLLLSRATRAPVVPDRPCSQCLDKGPAENPRPRRAGPPRGRSPENHNRRRARDTPLWVFAESAQKGPAFSGAAEAVPAGATWRRRRSS